MLIKGLSLRNYDGDMRAQPTYPYKVQDYVLVVNSSQPSSGMIEHHMTAHSGATLMFTICESETVKRHSGTATEFKKAVRNGLPRLSMHDVCFASWPVLSAVQESFALDSVARGVEQHKSGE